MTRNVGILADTIQAHPNLRIETEHLRIIPGTLELWEAERGERNYFAELLRARVPENWPPPLVPDPSEGGWWTWYVVARGGSEAEEVLVGSGGMKGWPALTGEIQLGCSFLLEFQALGYGTELIRALTRWSLEQPNVRHVFAEIHRDHEAAREVLNRVGFVRVGKGAAENLDRFKYHQ
jgi:[ribosomal protein S5]-alanine N-acetyltransferase